jgi:hypothetical protein
MTAKRMLTIGIDKGEDEEIIAVQKRLCDVVARLVTFDQLLRNILDSACMR